MGAIELTRLVAPPMRERGWGRIVHLSSSMVTEGVLETDAGRIGSQYYAAAKAALHGFSRSSAFQPGPGRGHPLQRGDPGLTRTFRNEERMANSFGVAERYAARAPLSRLLDAQPRVARVVVFLASAANTSVTGQSIPVTAGAYMAPREVRHEGCGPSVARRATRGGPHIRRSVVELTGSIALPLEHHGWHAGSIRHSEGEIHHRRTGHRSRGRSAERPAG